MKISARNILSLISLLVSLYFLIRLPFFTGWIISYLEQNFSPDNQLNVFSRFAIISGYGIFFVLTFSYCVLVLLNIHRRLLDFLSIGILRFLKSFIHLQRLNAFFLTDVHPNLSKLNFRILAISSVIGFLLVFGFLYFGYPEYEGTIENICALVVFCAIIFLVIAVFRVSAIRLSKNEIRKIRVVLILITALLFLYLGEEISWGQHIFGWQARGVFQEHNYQSETNFHNFFNPVIPLFYFLFGMGSFTMLFLIWFFPSENLSTVQKILTPSPAFFVLLFIMTGISFQGQSELYEAMFSLLVFLYGVRALYIMQILKFNGRTKLRYHEI